MIDHIVYSRIYQILHFQYSQNLFKNSSLQSIIWLLERFEFPSYNERLGSCVT